MAKQPKTPEGTLGGSQAVLAWSKDPQTFIREALGVSFLSRQQREACDAVRDLVWAKIKVGTGQKVTHAEQALSKKIGVSIMSGKGTGKDAITSMLIIRIKLHRRVRVDSKGLNTGSITPDASSTTTII